MADAVVFVITPDSVASKVCRIELDYASEQSKRLVPILARQTPTGDVPPALAELHWLRFLDGTDVATGVDRLVEVLDTDLPRVRRHTRLLTEAREWETHSRDRSLLLRGAELKAAETWSADQTGRHTRPGPTDLGQPPCHHPPPEWRRGHRFGGAGADGDTDIVFGVAFSPDGTVVTGSADHTLRWWTLDATRVTDRLCHIIGAPSRADWARLIPDLPYQPLCH